MNKLLKRKLQKVIPFNDSIKHTFQSKYGLTKEHLIGVLENFPIEIVERMLYEQELQGNIPNLEVFKPNLIADKKQGGFDWDISENGIDFWRRVLTSKNFDYFFTQYPKSL